MFEKRKFPRELFEKKYNRTFPDYFMWVEDDIYGWGILEEGGPINDLLLFGDEWLAAVPQKRVCLQAGGCCGMYPYFYSLFFDTVHTFEPYPQSYHCLEHNIIPQNNIYCNNYSLGAENKIATLKCTHSGRGENNIGFHRIVDREPMNLDVYTEMKTIDSFEYPIVDLIHLDTEHYEPNIIEGARETINRCRPVIISESSLNLQEYGYIEYEHTSVDIIYVPKELDKPIIQQ